MKELDENEEGGHKQRQNRSHKNAWCPALIILVSPTSDLLSWAEDDPECDPSSLGYDDDDVDENLTACRPGQTLY